MAGSVYSKVLRQWVRVEEQEALEAQRAAELADDTISYVGKGKSDKVHMIDGASKKQEQPIARCGVWVSNRNRQATVNDTICKKCIKGGTSFSTYNQPRDCSDCGRKFADSTRRDSNESLCPDCFERAGLYNEHSDGMHDGAANEQCPECQEQQQALVEQEQGQQTESVEAPSDASVGAALTEIIAATLHKDWLLGTGKPNKDGGQTIQFKMPDGRMVIISVGVFS